MQEEINPPRGLDEFSTGIWCWTDNRMDLIFFGEALHILPLHSPKDDMEGGHFTVTDNTEVNMVYEGVCGRIDGGRMKVKSESEVAQSYPTLSDSMDCSLPGSSIHGIVQARVLEWLHPLVAINLFSTSMILFTPLAGRGSTRA